MNYSPAVLERVRDPKYAGALPRDAADVGTGEAGTLDERDDDADPGARRSGGAPDLGGGVQGVRLQRGDCEREPGDRAAAGRVAWRRRERWTRSTIVAELELPIERAHVAALAVRGRAGAAIEDWERKTMIEISESAARVITRQFEKNGLAGGGLRVADQGRRLLGLQLRVQLGRGAARRPIRCSKAPAARRSSSIRGA